MAPAVGAGEGEGSKLKTYNIRFIMKIIIQLNMPFIMLLGTS
jgi:hypothetical protein